MEKVYLYDSYGIGYRCMFAGVDNQCRAQWLNITPGEEAQTMQVIDPNAGFDDDKFYLLSLVGEKARSQVLASVLGRSLACRVDGATEDLVTCLHRLQDLGVTWNHDPLRLKIRVFRNGVNSRRNGKYSFWIEDNDEEYSIMNDIDDEDDLNEIMYALRAYFQVVEMTAGIPVEVKTLCISNDLKQEIDLNYLEMFDSITEDKVYSNFNN